MKITFIYENSLAIKGLKHGFGFSCLIEDRDKKILFDIGGNKEAFFYNIQKLKINLNSITHLIFSHQHWDHTSGFTEVVKKLNDKCLIYIPFKFNKNLLNQIPLNRVLIKTRNIRQICKNFSLIVLKGSSLVLKEFFSVYEQSLIIQSPKGLIIITGCAHPGIIKILENIKKEFKEEIYCVIGGFHLTRSFEKNIIHIIDNFNMLNIKNVVPCHCSGKKALKLFEERFINKTYNIGTGSVINI